MNNTINDNNNKSFDFNTKKNVSVIVLGHVHHGKSSLGHAITKILTKKGLCKRIWTLDDLNSSPEEQASSMTINLTYISYLSEKWPNRYYSHIDAPGHREFTKNVAVGLASVDIAIVCVSADDSVASQTTEHLRMLFSLGIQASNIIICITKVDKIVPKDTEFAKKKKLQEEQFKMNKMIVEDTMKNIGFKDKDIAKTQMIWGAPGVVADPKLASRVSKEEYEFYKQKVCDVINALDNIPNDLIVRKQDKNFRLFIEKVVAIKGRGNVLTGTVKSGSITIGEKVDVMGYNIKQEAIVTDIEVFHTKTKIANTGSNVGILCRMDTVPKSGMILCTKNSTKLYKKFYVDLYIFKENEGGRKKPFKLTFKPVLFIGTAAVSIKFLSAHGGPLGDVINETEQHFRLLKRPIDFKIGLIQPGFNIIAEIEVNKAMAIWPDIKVIVREGHATIARGRTLDTIKAQNIIKPE